MLGVFPLLFNGQWRESGPEALEYDADDPRRPSNCCVGDDGRHKKSEPAKRQPNLRHAVPWLGFGKVSRCRAREGAGLSDQDGLALIELLTF
jgi:hypothetical protein